MVEVNKADLERLLELAKWTVNNDKDTSMVTNEDKYLIKMYKELL